MNNRAILFFIIFFCLSILGVALTQYFWITNAVELRKEQFNDKINVGLKSLVNDLYIIKRNNLENNDSLYSESIHIISPSTQKLDYKLIDSLINRELINTRINSEYSFGLFKILKEEKLLVYSSNTKYQNHLLDSPHQVSLSPIFDYKDAYFLSVYFPYRESYILKQMLFMIFASAFFVILVGLSFLAAVYSSFKQKKATLVRNDFINNMTHEFKTPISTVSLSAEMLLSDPILSQPAKAKKYASVVLEESQRLRLQVEQVLQMAVIDKGELSIKKRELDVHKLILDIINKMEINVEKRGGVVRTYLNAKKTKIWADKMHMTNVLSNLLDNANKYTPDTPIIVVRTKNYKEGIIISVEDNGIGIKSDDQKDIFKQFRRVHTGNLHDVKGFGLGLYYVKLLTEAHGGHVKLTSEWGNGSIFELFFPFNKSKNVT
jgi:two-component system phosphate regulon sensor histidine kinase PhoR